MLDKSAGGFGLGDAFEESLSNETFEVRSPHDPEYGYDPDKWTPSQEEQWRYYRAQQQRYFRFRRALEAGEIVRRIGGDGGRERFVDAESEEEVEIPHIRMADLGGVGSGKTHFGGGIFGATQVQEYPGSIGLMIANTREQTERGPLPEFKQVMTRLGYSWQDASYHKEKIIRGTPYKRIIVVRLSDSKRSFIRIASFHKAQNLESEEFDWGVMSEVQDADESKFMIAYRRIRTTYANNAIFAEGTPRKRTHWQYSTIPNLGFNVWKSDTRDNPHKIAGYAENLRKGYPPHKARAYISGEPIKKSSDAIFYTFDWDDHLHAVPDEVCRYDPDRPIHVCMDFNLSPMSVSMWQKKPSGRYDLDPGLYAEEIWAQVGEIENWTGGTRGAALDIKEKIRDHGFPGGVIKGDATGSRKDPKSPDQSDWDIVREVFADMPRIRIQPGIDPGTVKDGKRTWNNPPVRTRNMAGNLLLKDGTGTIGVVFRESGLDSGGVPASVADYEKAEDGSPAKSKDKTKSRSATQTHFADTFAYHAYDVLRREGRLGGQKPADKAAKERDSLGMAAESAFSTDKRFGNAPKFR